MLLYSKEFSEKLAKGITDCEVFCYKSTFMFAGDITLFTPSNSIKSIQGLLSFPTMISPAKISVDL